MKEIKVDDFKKYKECDKELLQLVKDNFVMEEDLEDIGSFDYNGLSYGLVEIDGGKWISGGKYEDRTVMFQLVSYDERNVVDRYNLFLRQFMYRTGSHYTDWYYTFEEPCINTLKIINVPEVVIPAHEEIKMEEIKSK